MSPSHFISSREEPLSLVLFSSVSLGVVMLPRDTHHPFLSLNDKIENIPLEVERQQGWRSNWGGKEDGGEVSSQGSERAAMVRWPPAQDCLLSSLAASPLLHQPQAIGSWAGTQA